MNTVSHILFAAALLTRRAMPAGSLQSAASRQTTRSSRIRNVAAVAGGFAPDAYLFVVWGWTTLAGIPGSKLWGEIYWTAPVQMASAISNSIPLYALLLIICLLFRSRVPGLTGLCVFATAALLHCALDLPVHVTDAHRHFWPISDWRFQSPVSYWDRGHHSGWVQWVEWGLALVAIVVLWMRFSSLWVRILLLLAIAAYVAVPLYFRAMV